MMGWNKDPLGWKERTRETVNFRYRNQRQSSWISSRLEFRLGKVCARPDRKMSLIIYVKGDLLW